MIRFQQGDRVQHKLYGAGKVTSVTPDGKWVYVGLERKSFTRPIPFAPRELSLIERGAAKPIQKREGNVIRVAFLRSVTQ